MFFREHFGLTKEQNVAGWKLVHKTIEKSPLIIVECKGDTCRFVSEDGTSYEISPFFEWQDYDLVPPKGMLFYIEGVDSVGKATQTELLRRNLKGLGYEVKTFSYPNYTTQAGKLIKEYLNGGFGDASVIPGKLIGSVYALDRASDSEAIKHHLSQGGIVIMDRSPYSNAAFQGSKGETEEERKELFDWFVELELGQMKLAKPDIVFFLDADPQIARKLMEERKETSSIASDGKKDQHESNTDMLTKAYHLYVDEAKKNKDWCSIPVTKDDCIRNPIVIGSEILGYIMGLVPEEDSCIDSV